MDQATGKRIDNKPSTSELHGQESEKSEWNWYGGIKTGKRKKSSYRWKMWVATEIRTGWSRRLLTDSSSKHFWLPKESQQKRQKVKSKSSKVTSEQVNRAGRPKQLVAPLSQYSFRRKLGMKFGTYSRSQVLKYINLNLFHHFGFLFIFQ